MQMLNKNAAENTAISSTAKESCKKYEDSFKLSNKIKVLYRYIRLAKQYKAAIYQAINTFYEVQK